jgi:hypothetical protein
MTIKSKELKIKIIQSHKATYMKNRNNLSRDNKNRKVERLNLRKDIDEGTLLRR